MSKAQFAGFLNTPSIWRGKQFGIQQFEFPSVNLSSFQPIPLPGNLRLGHQIEHIFRQLIEHSATFSIVLHNLPISKEGQTLGEIDFILRNSTTDKLIHVELTYKFYLILPEVADPIRKLIGPNRRDKFSYKVSKIRDRQFGLLDTAEGAEALHQHSIDPSEIEHQCCFKAQLFQPYGSTEVQIGSFNQACIRGYWLNFNDFNTPHFAKALFYMPTKSEWVIEPHEQIGWKGHSEILTEIRQSHLRERAPMLWVKRAEGALEKLFVVWW